MATKNFVPRATGQGQIGTTSKKWLRHTAISGSFTHVSASVFQVTDLLGDISGSITSTGSFGRLEVAGNSSLTGDLTLGGNIQIGDATTDSITITADLSSSLIPNVSDAYNLGSATQRWNNLFLSGSVSASGGPHHFEGNVGLGNYAPPEVLTVTGDISASGDFHGLSGTLTLGGNISGSSTSSASFGRIDSSGRIFEAGSSVIDHATAMAIVFGG